MLATDDVVRLRVAASRWNKGDWYGPLGRVFFNMLKLERHKELWHYDTDGNRVITSVAVPRSWKVSAEMDSNCHVKENLKMDKKKWTWPSMETSCFREVYLLHTISIWDLPEVLEEATSGISSGSMSPDLDDTWHQGLPTSPQWEGELELGSDSNNQDEIEYECENDEDSNYEELDRVAARGARDNISEVRESSLWAPLCDCLTPADVLVLRTSGSKWYNAKWYGEFAELWFFLLKRKGGNEPPLAPLPEWPGMFEPGQLPDLTAFEDSGEWT